MPPPVLIAHTDDDQELANALASPLADAGYKVVYSGSVLVGESVVGEADKALQSGAPVVVCATVAAMGTGWAYRLVRAARGDASRTRVFVVQMERDAFVEQLNPDGRVAEYWRSPSRAIGDLIASLQRYFPTDDDLQDDRRSSDAELRYRDLALKACDIINLANLPEDDRHLAARELELRRLYVALRVRVDSPRGSNESHPRMLEGAPDSPYREDNRMPVGERLAEAHRLVVLGDPGAGKTTMLRWIATAYLLRLKHDPDWKDLPDVATLPDEDWLPILIRCRDLDGPSLSGSLDDILGHTLRKAELGQQECRVVHDLLLRRLSSGLALLLVDGLDEIADPAMRARFCQQLEQIHLARPAAPVIVTSRIVGYREMDYRIGRGFEHVTVADLDREDKDDFARRWCAVTEVSERRERAAAELIDDIHSTDRIERLTGNPMLLTTMALVKRKIGKLPSRRADLYWSAVQVLLNWRREVDEPLDQHEAIPQLEYLAYAMCDRGAQQLRRDEVIDLLEQMRAEYPQIHAITQHSSTEFLALLEGRTGIVVQTGEVRHFGRPAPVYEFRHLTFQEYLAGLALVEGRFPNRDRSKSLAEAVAPLAAQVRTVELRTDVQVNWQEAIRLCVLSCNDDDVDDVVRAVLRAGGAVTSTPTDSAVVLAALCLTDEPNVSEDVAHEVLRSLAEQIPETSPEEDPVSRVAVELGRSRWSAALTAMLMPKFFERVGFGRTMVGSIIGQFAVPSRPGTLDTWVAEQIERLKSEAEEQTAKVALEIAQVAYAGYITATPAELTDRLLDLLDGGGPVAHAAAWAIWGLNFRTWTLNSTAVERILAAFYDRSLDSEAVRFCSLLLGGMREARAAPRLLSLRSASEAQAQAAADALRRIGNAAIEPLLGALDSDAIEDRDALLATLAMFHDPRVDERLSRMLEDPDSDNRRSAVQALASTLDDGDRELLTEDFRWGQYLDPSQQIDAQRVRDASSSLGLPEDNVRERYRALASRLSLKLVFDQPMP